MTSIGSNTTTSTILRALMSLHEDADRDIKAIGEEIDDVVNYKKTIHQALDKLRKDGDVDGFFRFLDQEGNEALSERFGDRPEATEDVPGTGRPERSITIPITGQKIVLDPGRPADKRHSRDQIEAMKDTLKDIGDEATQMTTKLQLRFQTKNQLKSETASLMSNSLKSDHDSQMTAIGNSKA